MSTSSPLAFSPSRKVAWRLWYVFRRAGHVMHRTAAPRCRRRLVFTSLPIALARPPPPPPKKKKPPRLHPHQHLAGGDIRGSRGPGRTVSRGWKRLFSDLFVEVCVGPASWLSYGVGKEACRDAVSPVASRLLDCWFCEPCLRAVVLFIT